MENFESNQTVNERIAKNLIFYRKRAGLTQAELAERINYSDKSISKWESANGIPDVYILLKLANLYGVTINHLVSEYDPSTIGPVKPSRFNSSFIMLLSSGIVWLVATFVFVLLQIAVSNKPWWLSFVYACPITAIVVTVLSAVYKRRTTNFCAVTALIWTTILSTYLTIYIIAGRNYWLMFILGVPLQSIWIWWAIFRIEKKRIAERKKKSLENLEEQGQEQK